MLEISNVNKSYQKKSVIKNLNVSFDKGIYALLAPNGYGKTTIINMLATVLRPSSGRIAFDGKSIHKNIREYRNILGYLPQKVGYYENYTACENLSYIATLKNINPKIAKKRINELLKYFGLYDVKNKKLKSYSGGMVQRVGIIGTLLNNPKIILLDEPTAGLDPKERNVLKSKLVELGKKNTVIISTHITSDIEFISNKIVMLGKKDVMYNDTTDNIRRRMDGKIFEMDINERELLQINEKYFVLDEQNNGQSVKVRLYSETPPARECIVAPPRLEDVFLCEYKRKG